LLKGSKVWGRGGGSVGSLNWDLPTKGHVS
jgi:hypothetical protein